MAAATGLSSPGVQAGRKRKRSGRRGEGDGDIGSSHDSDVFSDSSVKSPSGRQKRIKTELEDYPKTNNVSAAFPHDNAANKRKVPPPVHIKTEQVSTGHSDPGGHGHSGNSTATSPAPAIKTELWPEEDLNKLLQKMEAVLPKDDIVKYTTQVDRLDWSKIMFDQRSAEDCKKMWLLLSVKLRRFRTLTELVVDAAEYVKNPNKKGTKNAYPDMPKRPQTPYIRFFMSKRPAYAAKHPDMSLMDVTKALAAKFKLLPDSKKQKYIEAYNKENEEFKIAMEKFKKDHPEYVNTPSKKLNNSSSAGKNLGDRSPTRPQTALQFFYKEKLDEYKSKHPNEGLLECQAALRKKWNALSDSKKIKFIKRALDDKARYDHELEDYVESHPEYEAKVMKTILTKAEQRIKDNADGKPRKPPSSGYSLFSSQLMPKLKDIASHDKMTEVSRQWKALSDHEREEYNQKSEMAMKQYKKDFAAYLEKLPEDEREKLVQQTAPANKKVKTNTSTNGPAPKRPHKPISAMTIFMEEKRDAYQLKHSDLTTQELTRLLIKDFNSLPEEKKEKYKRKAEHRKEKMQQEIDTQETSQGRSMVKRSFPGEPKKPPGSGYSLFTAENISKLTDVPNNQRIQTIGQMWRKLSEKEKNEYKKKLKKMQTQYQKELKKFTDGLSAKEKKQYEEFKEQQKGAKGKKATGKKSNKKPWDAGETEEENVSSSDSYSDEEDDDSSSSEEAESGSDSGSEDEEEEEEGTTQNGEEAESSSDDDSSSGEEGSDSESGSGSDGDEDGDEESEEGSEEEGDEDESGSEEESD